MRRLITQLMEHFLEHPEDLPAAPPRSGAPRRPPGTAAGRHRSRSGYDRPVCAADLLGAVHAHVLGQPVSPLIKDSSIQAVLSAANIVDVVSGYTSLRKRGATYTGLCPFHQEKTPSFTVSADKGLYYCFGCGEGGDVVRFLEHMENLSFAETIEQLGERFGGRWNMKKGAGRTPVAETGTPGFCRCWRRRPLSTRGFYGRLRAGGSPAITWRDAAWEKRSAGPSGSGTRRMSGEDFHRRAAKEGFTDRELDEAGLLVRQAGKTYDRFRGRLMFPLVDHRGRVLGFGGRTLKDETPKYVNSPEGPLYQKGSLLYGLYQARRAIADADEVVVVEGYTDVLGLVQAGVGNVVASMGTALTDSQIGLMMRFTGNVTFMFDADRAGTEAMLRSGELARGHSLRPMVAVLPGGRDPADVAVQGGREAVMKVLGGKISLLGFELRQALARSETSTADGRCGPSKNPAAHHELGRLAQGARGRDPLVADRLRLSSDSISLLLRGGPQPSPARARSARNGTQPSLARRLLGSETAVERDSPGGRRLQSGSSGLDPRGAHTRTLLRPRQP